MKTKSCAGQALIEALISILGLSGISVAILALFYLGFMKVQAQHFMNEALICSISAPVHKLQNSQRKVCSAILIQKTSELMGKPKLQNLKWKKTAQEVALSLELVGWRSFVWKMPPLHFQKSLALPISSSLVK